MAASGMMAATLQPRPRYSAAPPSAATMCRMMRSGFTPPSSRAGGTLPHVMRLRTTSRGYRNVHEVAPGGGRGKGAWGSEGDEVLLHSVHKCLPGSSHPPALPLRTCFPSCPMFLKPLACPAAAKPHPFPPTHPPALLLLTRALFSPTPARPAAAKVCR